MGSRDEAPSVALSKLEAAARHNRVLPHALQTAHQVVYQGKWRFIHTITYATSGGTIDVIVYLTGDSEPVDPDLLTLAPEIT